MLKTTHIKKHKLIKLLVIFVTIVCAIIITLFMLWDFFIQQYNPLVHVRCLSEQKEYLLGGCARRVYSCENTVITHTDGGKSCSDSSECQGACITTWKNPSEKGTCSYTNKLLCSCYTLLDKTIPYNMRSICVD